MQTSSNRKWHRLPVALRLRLSVGQLRQHRWHRGSCSYLGDGICGGDPDAKAPPPPLAICNNWAAIALSAEIRDMNPTWAELSVSARAQVAVRYEVNGKGRYRLLSHNMVFLNAQPAADSLPRELTSDEYYVVFAKMSDNEVVHTLR